MLEELTRGESQPGFAGSRHHLDGQDRIASQLEEVVVCADPLDLEHILPDVDQDAFVRVRRGDIRTAGGFEGRRGQRVAVELVTVIQRQPIDGHEDRWHHRFGQSVA